MIPKISKGSGFPPTLRYVFRMRAQDKDVDRSLVRQVAGSVWEEDVREIIKQFESTRADKPNIEKPVWHCSLSVRKEEGRLGPQKWQEIAESFMKSKELMFPEGLSWVAVWHGDKAHDHIHIVASRIAFGKVWDDKRDMLKANRVTARLEREFNLVPTVKTKNNCVRKVADKDYQKAIRRGEYPERRRLQIIIDKAIERPTSYADFLSFLALNGVQVRENRASTGKLSGLSFYINDIHFKGSQLGKNEYSLSQLIRRGGLYGYENHIRGYGQESPEGNQDATAPGSTSEERGASLSSPLHHGRSESSGWYGRNIEGIYEGLERDRFDIVSDDDENRETEVGLHKLFGGDGQMDKRNENTGQQSSENLGLGLYESDRQAELNPVPPAGERGNNHQPNVGNAATDIIPWKSSQSDDKSIGRQGKDHAKITSYSLDSRISPRSSDSGGHHTENRIPLSGRTEKLSFNNLGDNNPCRDCPTPDSCESCSFKHLRKKLKAIQKGGRTR